MADLSFNRRQALKALGVTAAATLLKLPLSAKDKPQPSHPAFQYSLNMATIRGQKLGFIKELEVASKAGFRSVEIWIDSFQAYLQSGGSASEAKRIIGDLGLQIENAIGFAEWIVDDEATRKAGLSQLQREMESLASIGCKRIAAPPAGANDHNAAFIDLDVVTERYLTILKMGEQTGVMPILEMWGSSPNLQRISQVLYVIIESGHKDARVLLDTFHIFKGGSSFDSLPFVGRTAMEILHVNDYPAGIPLAQLSDADRVYPGDGVAPLRQALQAVKDPNRPLILSLEVFNQRYYQQDALLVAKTGLAKMKALTEGI